jgi:hypothetical protein
VRLTLDKIWLNATTIPNSKGQVQSWRRNYTNNPKRQINQLVPFVGTKTLLVSASFWGLTEKSVHLTNILFMNCEIIEEKAPEPEPFQTQEPTIIDDEKPKIPVKTTYAPVPNSEPSYSSATHFKVTYQNTNYWVKKIDMRKQDVLIRCSCSDYYHTWSWANFINGIQFGGRFKPYIRKTKTMPPRNPNPRKYFGLCKHVSQLAQMLQTSGFAV